MKQIKASHFIAEFLARQNVKYVFEVAGGMITHILDSIHCLTDINIISMHHEQSAAFAADAIGRVTGRPGVAFATSGPGATNLLTGIASCYFDSSPALFITGQVNTHEQKGKRKIRQLGFQETDIVSMAKPITKRCFKVETADQLEEIMYKAFLLAITDRKGPVLIDVPMNIQSSIISVDEIKYIENTSTFFKKSTNNIDLLFDAILNAKRPLILAGNGIACSSARNEFIKFVDFLKIPVVYTLLAVDIIPYDHKYKVGLIGSYGNRWANLAIGRSDLLIVIGSRLDIRQTGAHIEGFVNGKTIFHVDCDKNEINNRIKNCIPIVSQVNAFLSHFSKFYSLYPFNDNENWLNEINFLKRDWPDVNELKDFKGINPNYLMHELSLYASKAAAFLADVGNHQMWAAQSLDLKDNQLFLTSGGLGSMGFALPAAIGTCLALNKKPIVIIVGDGGFQMNIQELQTVIRNKLPIKIIVLNNQVLGMIRQFQDSYFQGRYQSTNWGYSAPDFLKIGAAYGLEVKTIHESEEISQGLTWLFENKDEAGLLQVMINPYMNVYPKIAFGKPITDMEPFSKPIAMEAT